MYSKNEDNLFSDGVNMESLHEDYAKRWSSPKQMMVV